MISNQPIVYNNDIKTANNIWLKDLKNANKIKVKEVFKRFINCYCWSLVNTKCQPIIIYENNNYLVIEATNKNKTKLQIKIQITNINNFSKVDLKEKEGYWLMNNPIFFKDHVLLDKIQNFIFEK